ncbi:hypothetical protein AAZX31_11G140700 [Glycine max]
MMIRYRYPCFLFSLFCFFFFSFLPNEPAVVSMSSYNCWVQEKIIHLLLVMTMA